MLRGRLQIVSFPVDLAHTHVHVCRSAQHRHAVFRCKLQRLLVRAHGIVQATLRDPDVGYRDRAT